MGLLIAIILSIFYFWLYPRKSSNRFCSLIFITLGILNLLIIWFTVFIPKDLDYEEGILLQLSNQFSKSGLLSSLYPDPNAYPLVVNNYTPLYLLVSSLSIKLLGLDMSALRLISFISLVGSLFILYLIIKRISDNRLVAIMLSLFFMTYFGRKCFYLARVDMMETLLILLSIYFFLTPKIDRSRNYYFSLFFLILAIFTKQTAIFFLAAYLIIFLLYREYKRFFLFGLLSLATMGLLTYLLNCLTRGQFFTQAIYENYSYGLMAQQVYLLNNFLLQYRFLLLTALLSLFINYRDRQYQKIFFIFTITFLSAACCSLKPGAGYNYFIDVYILLLLLIAGLISKLMKHRGTAIFVAALFLLQLFVLINSNYYELRYDMKESQVYNKILKYIESENKMNIFSSYLSFGVKTKGLGIYDEYGYFQKLRQKRWKNDILINGCKRHDYSIVGVGKIFLGGVLANDAIIDHPESKEFKDCLEKYYVQLNDRYLHMRVYLPADKVDKFKQFMR